MIKFKSANDRDIYVNPAHVLSIEPHATDGHTEITFTNGTTKQVKGTAEASLRTLGFGSKEEVKKSVEAPKAAPVTTPTPSPAPTAAPASGSAK
jgi:hypothetical protein